MRNKVAHSVVWFLQRLIIFTWFSTLRISVTFLTSWHRLVFALMCRVRRARFHVDICAAMFALMPAVVLVVLMNPFDKKTG